MSNLDLLTMALRNLWRRKLRTSLTLLGVLIGSTSIIVMVSLGLGLKQATLESFQRLGSLTTISVRSQGGYGRLRETGSSGSSKQAYLNDETVEKLRQLPYVTAVGPLLEAEFNSPIKLGRYQLWGRFVGVGKDYFADFGIVSDTEAYPSVKNQNRPQVLFPSNYKSLLFDPSGMINLNMQPRDDASIDVHKVRLKIDFMKYDAQSGRETVERSIPVNLLGLYESNNWQGYIYMLLDDIKQLNAQYKKLNEAQSAGGEWEGQSLTQPQSQSRNKDIYSTIDVKVSDMSKVAEVRAAIEGMGFFADSLMDVVNEANKQMGTMQSVLAGIGAISLLVAAIGITNTMVMSIYERTREIGVMKVIGASVAEIRKIFLTEAVLIGLMGGTLGIAFSFVISALLNQLLGSAFQSNMGAFSDGGGVSVSLIPIWLVAAAFVFSGAIGLVAGYYPAKRATKLSAIEAIKTE